MFLKIVDQKQTKPFEILLAIEKGVISKEDIVYYSHFAYSLGLMLRYFKVANKHWWMINDEGTLILIES